MSAWFVHGSPPEVTPIDDVRVHDDGPKCWCRPSTEDGVLIHNALDGRNEANPKKMKLVK